MKKDIAVIGLGIFGYEVALRLAEKGNSVLAVDIDRDRVEKIRDHVTGAATADITDEDAIKELDVAKFHQIILGLGDHFEQLVLGVSSLKKFGAQHIIARATTEIQQEILLRIGADEVVLPEKQSAIRLAARITVPNIMEFLKLDDEVNVAEIHVDQHLAGKNLAEIDLRKKFHITALILKREGEQPKIITSPEFILNLDDTLVVVGRHEDIEKFFS